MTPWLVAQVAAVETFQSHDPRHASQHRQDSAKGRLLSQLNQALAMGLARFFADYSNNSLEANLLTGCCLQHNTNLIGCT